MGTIKGTIADAKQINNYMSNITNAKPEPITAKPNWHYDSYFLAQLQRLNLHKSETSFQKRHKVNTRLDKLEVEFEIERSSD